MLERVTFDGWIETSSDLETRREEEKPTLKELASHPREAKLCR
jgi:hypothetical protein